MPESILYWNAVALEANRRDFTKQPGEKTEQGGPTLSSRALAIIHLAMYDAFAGASGNPLPDLPAYMTGLPPVPTGATPQASAAAAAHATLTSLFPSQKAYFAEQLSNFGAVDAASQKYGVAVAKAILAERKNDPGASDDGYTPVITHGGHRPDPDNPDQGFHAPFYGAKSNGFAIQVRHELDAPPFNQNPPAIAEYKKALRQVRGKGISAELMGTLPTTISKRNVDETLIGLFWGYDGAFGLGTPPRLYNQIVREVAVAQGNTEAKNARLFALVNAAMGDAGILAWDQKYVHNFWRPVLGIREHDASMGVDTTPNNNISNDCDTNWLPLGAPATNSTKLKFTETADTFPFNQAVFGRMKNFTPNFPAYPSGHATFGAAALHITRLFYGVTEPGEDDLFDGLSFVSDEFNGISTDNRGTIRPRHERNFPRGLWQMIEENGRSRVFLGVHWVFDAFAEKANGEIDLSKNIGGAKLGIDIAEDIFNSGLVKSMVTPRP